MATTTAPSMIDVLNKMKEYAELPADKQPSTCPLNQQERQVFEQNYHSLLTQCPAFAHHNCPFDHVKNMKDVHEKIKHIDHEQVKKCPAFDDHHGEMMRVLKDDIKDQ